MTEVSVQMETPVKMGWSEDRVELLKKLWEEGLSASQIATQLGGGITRNAVIGKVHRERLPGRENPSHGSTKQREPRKSGPRGGLRNPPSLTTFVDGVSQKVRASKMPPLPEPPPLSVTESADGKTKYTILHLSDKTCKWPIGDPVKEDFCFCGHGPREGTPYCEYHARLAYSPPQTRRSGYAS